MKLLGAFLIFNVFIKSYASTANSGPCPRFKIQDQIQNPLYLGSVLWKYMYCFHLTLCLFLCERYRAYLRRVKSIWHYSNFREKNHLIDMTILVLGIACKFLDYIMQHLFAGMLEDKEKIEQNE